MDELAEQLRWQWERAAAEQGLMYPTPIPVWWRWSPRQVTGPIAAAVGERGGRRFQPLPEMAAVTEEQLHRGGTLRDLLGVYGGLSSGRLIVLGEPGAGKTAAGIRLLLDALAHRATTRIFDERRRVPVPVLVTPHGWDPTTESLAQWLATRLTQDYPLLRAPEYGRDVASRLIEGGYLAVILDGLDEMPETLRSVALRALDEQATFRLVVLTRSRELVAAVSGAHLRGAAALELMPINPQEAADYLASSQIDPLPAPWHHLINHLWEHPDSLPAQTLNTPLMLTLVRDTYGPGDPVDELIDFRTQEAIRDHLFDRLLTAAYSPRLGRPTPQYTAARARQWLTQLARRMHEEGTRDLTWWQISRWAPAWPRAFATVAIISLIAALLIGSMSGLVAYMHLTSEFRFGPLAALSAVFGKTVAYALTYAFVFAPGYLIASPHAGRFPRQRGLMRWTRTDAPTILLTGLGLGLVLGLWYAFTGALGLVSGLLLGLAFGLTSGLLLEARQPSTQATTALDPRSLWRRERQSGLRFGLVFGLVFGLLYGLVAGLVAGPMYGLAYGLIDGFVAGIGSALVSSTTWAATLANVQLWLRGEAPINLLHFLDDAHARQVLRTVGPAYQFRHTQLQDRLIRTVYEPHEAAPEEAKALPEPETCNVAPPVLSSHRSQGSLGHAFTDGLGSIFDLTGTATSRRRYERSAWDYLEQRLTEKIKQSVSDVHTSSDWPPDSTKNDGRSGR